MTKAQIPMHRIEIAERIEEAWDTLKRVPDRERDLLKRQGHAWPVMLHSAVEHAAWKPSRMRRRATV